MDATDPLKLIEAVKRSIEKVITIHLGIRPGLLSDDLLEAVISELIQKFKSLSIQDIEWAYERHNFGKRDDWRMVTKAEIMEPIQAWAWKVSGIGNELEKFKAQEAEESKAEEKAAKFKAKSLKLYNEGVDKLEWSGDIFEASAIARDLSKKIPKELKGGLWRKAQEESKEIEEENTKIKRLGGVVSFSKIGRTPERLFSEMIVKIGIQNGIKL